MKTNPLAVLIMFLSILLASCTTIRVVSDYDKDVDFSKFKTIEYYGWAEESDKILSPFDKERIENAFAEEFEKRGIKVVKEGGDLLATLFIVVEDKTKQVAETTNFGGYYGRYYGYGPGWGFSPSFSSTTIRDVNYKVGTLVIDVFDKHDKKLIWESIGTGTVDDNPQSREKSIPRAVAQIMATYPVPPEK